MLQSLPPADSISGKGTILAAALAFVEARFGKEGVERLKRAGQIARSGTTHTVYFVGGGERVELVHRAHTREHFALQRGRQMQVGRVSHAAFQRAVTKKQFLEAASISVTTAREILGDRKLRKISEVTETVQLRITARTRRRAASPQSATAGEATA